MTLYGADLIGDGDGGKPVLVVEGAASADLVRRVADPIYIVVGLLGGAEAVERTDWSMLKGRRVVVWPDMGREEIATAVADRIGPAAEEVKIIDPEHLTPAEAVFGSRAEWLAWAKPRARLWTQPVAVQREVHEAIAVPAQATVTDITVARNAKAKPKPKGDGSVQVRPNLAAVMSILERADYSNIVRYDEFHQKLFREDGEEFTPADTLRLTRHLQERWAHLGMDRVSTLTVKDAIRLHADHNRCNEVVEWLDTLAWDGISRIYWFAERYLGAEPVHYNRCVGHNFWVSMAARSYQPGCQVDSVMVLQGAQGIGKSTAMRVIGGKWHAEVAESVVSKDFYLAIQGKLLIEIAELEAFTRAEIAKVKQAITTTVDRFRPPYGEITNDYPRRCVFVGNTNEHDFLRDATGARRFWPVSCGHIDLEGLRRDRDQLFAEAVAAFHEGRPWHLMPEEETKRQQEERRSSDPWETIIDSYVGARVRVAMHEILAEALKIDPARMTRGDQTRAGAALRSLGWSPKLTWNSGAKKPERMWVREV